MIGSITQHWNDPVKKEKIGKQRSKAATFFLYLFFRNVFFLFRHDRHQFDKTADDHRSGRFVY